MAVQPVQRGGRYICLLYLLCLALRGDRPVLFSLHDDVILVSVRFTKGRPMVLGMYSEVVAREFCGALERSDQCDGLVRFSGTLFFVARCAEFT